jgi:hypothetical protein
MADTNTVLILSGVAATIFTNIFQLYRESRNRKWDRQDRAEKAATLAATTAKTAGAILTEIQKNTAISEAAFEVGNHVDERLSAIHRRIDVVAQEVNSPDKPPR